MSDTIQKNIPDVRSCVFRVMLMSVLAVLIAVAGLTHSQPAEAQSIESVSSVSHFRVGEKLTYNLSFGKFQNAGYAETNVVSIGTLSGHSAVELRSKVKTLNLVSAAFLMFDESRTVFAVPDTSLPLYIARNSHQGPIPKESIGNYLKEPTQNYDLLTLIYKIRETGGIGAFPLFENDQTYTAVFASVGAEKVKTDAGEFDTTVSTVTSEFLSANGIKELKINFDTSDFHVPVQIRLKTAKGEFRALLSAIVLPVVETPTPTPTPAPVQTPTKARPTPTPAEYIENRPLAPELGFQLGEVLDYRVTSGGRPLATISLNARQRKQLPQKVGNIDSLLLTATVTGVEPGVTDFRLGDAANVQADPETLAPRSMEAKFASVFPGLNQSLSFNRSNGNVSFGGEKPIDSPIGTHTILSLAYAMRSFNLRPSKDASSPVNDTRVAVFWETKAYVFTLRPSNPQDLIVNGEKISAQLITVNTGNSLLDALGIKVWLGTDDRVPLRFVFGSYQADLVSRSNNLFK